MMPKISVILPSYNHEKFIGEAIKSVLEQTFQDFELIIVDDGSSDRSVEIIRSFTDERIRLFCFAENQGAHKAGEKLLAEAKGEYVAVHHSDDVWEKTKLSQQVEFLDANPEYGACFTLVQFIDENNKTYALADGDAYKGIFEQENKSREAWLRQFFYNGNCLCHPSLLIHRNLYEKYNLLVENGLVQLPDFCIWVKLCLRENIYILQERLTYFRLKRDCPENTSADRPENHIRFPLEMYYVLQLYREIDSAADFLRVFPEAAPYMIDGEIDLDFALAQLSLKNPHQAFSSYYMLGISLLHELICDTGRAQQIKRLYGYTHSDFSADMARYDVFGVKNSFVYLKNSLYWTGNDRFDEVKKIQQTTYLSKNGRFYLRYALAQTSEPIKKLRFDPDEGSLLKIAIDKFLINGVEYCACAENAVESSNGFDLFWTVDPQYYVEYEGQEDLRIEVTGVIQRLEERELSVLAENKEAALQAAESELAAIYASRGYKAVLKLRHIRDRLRYFKKNISLQTIKKAMLSLCQDGPVVFWQKVKRRLFLSQTKLLDYELWREVKQCSQTELEMQRVATFLYEPLISIIVPTYNTPLPYLKAMLDSVCAQTYEKWELCIADASGQQQTAVRQLLQAYQQQDKRIKIVFLNENKGIVGNSNAALELSSGDYIALLDHDDTLEKYALYEIVKKINENRAFEFIYSDEDKIDAKGSHHFEPFFKPDWSPDRMRSYNYVCHLSVFKRSLLDKVGLFREGFEGSQDYDLFLRLTEQAAAVGHVAKVLYNWRVHENSTAAALENKMYCVEAAKKALKEHLRRCNLNGRVEDGYQVGLYRIRYQRDHSDKVSILIPNCNECKTLKVCINSILAKTTYDNYEILIIENNSTDQDLFAYYHELEQQDNIKILYWKKQGKFNYSALNNWGASFAKGRYLLFLNNDTEILTADWLEKMLEFGQREDVGCVGAALYYPDDTVQHAGVILGLGGVAGHSMARASRKDVGYFFGTKIVQNVGAVTAACMMLRREYFTDAGGFDEKLAVAFNDIDLCLRVLQLGKRHVYVPDVELYHYESKSRGGEDSPEKKARFAKEISLMKQRWGDPIFDPYYNINLTLDSHYYELRW